MSKTYKYFSTFLIIILCASNFLFAQQASLDGTKLLYRNFTSKGVSIASRGFSISYRKAKFVQGKDRIFDVEFATVRDPKEKKVSGNGTGFKSFYFGKINSVFDLRVGFGSQKSIYNKEVPNAIEIKRGFSFGASLATLKPIFVQLKQGGEPPLIISERYDPAIHSISTITGRASFFTGVWRTTFSPGLYLKHYYLFDFADDDEKIKALECGATIDAYLKGINIMAFNTPKRLMVTLYVSYIFGDKKF